VKCQKFQKQLSNCTEKIKTRRSFKRVLYHVRVNTGTVTDPYRLIYLNQEKSY